MTKTASESSLEALLFSALQTFIAQMMGEGGVAPLLFPMIKDN